MSGSLVHSPAYIIQKLLVNFGLGTAPAVAGVWPIYVSQEPDKPDSVITVYDTPGRQQGRLQTSGQWQELYGIQVRIRDAHHQDGYKKANAIATALDESIYQNTVTLEDNVGTTTSTYTVHSVSRAGGINSLGKDVARTKRSLFTVNALVSLKQVT